MILSAGTWEGLRSFVLANLEIQAADRGIREVVMSARHGRERLAAGRKRLVPLTERLTQRARDAGVLRPDASGSDLAVLSTMLAFEMNFAETVAPDLWRRHATVILDGLRARPDNTPLPGRPIEFGQLGDASPD
jgi:hypothetical protein